MLCKAAAGLSYSLYCCPVEQRLCAMTRFWDAERSGQPCSMEICVIQANVDLASIGAAQVT